MTSPNTQVTGFEATAVAPRFRNSPRRGRLLFLSLGALLFYPGVATAQTSNPCDLNADGAVTATGANSDVQLAINMTLGLTPCTANIISPGVCNVLMVQRVVNAALGGACTVGLTAPAHSASLTWAASTTPNVTYKVLRGATSGGPYDTMVASALSTTSYSDTTVQEGVTYYYVVRAVDAGAGESVNSNESTAAIPAT